MHNAKYGIFFSNSYLSSYRSSVIPRVRSTRGNPHPERASNIKGIATHLAVLAMTRKTEQLDKPEFNF